MRSFRERILSLISSLGFTDWNHTYDWHDDGWIRVTYTKYNIYDETSGWLVLEIILNDDSDSEDYNERCLSIIKEAGIKYRWSVDYLAPLIFLRYDLDMEAISVCRT